MHIVRFAFYDYFYVIFVYSHIFTDTLPFTQYEDADNAISLLVSECTPFAMLMDENDAPQPHHISMIIGGECKDSLELAFGLGVVLKLMKCGGKASKLKSLTYLQPSEYTTHPEM